MVRCAPEAPRSRGGTHAARRRTTGGAIRPSRRSCVAPARPRLCTTTVRCPLLARGGHPLDNAGVLKPKGSRTPSWREETPRPIPTPASKGKARQGGPNESGPPLVLCPGRRPKRPLRPARGLDQWSGVEAAPATAPVPPPTAAPTAAPGAHPIGSVTIQPIAAPMPAPVAPPARARAPGSECQLSCT